MPGKRVSMRKIREVLRLKWGLGVDERQIARSCRISRSTLWEYLRRAKDAGLGWPLPAELDDAALEALLFRGDPDRGAVRPEPNWQEVHRERKRKGVTLLLLWQEYIAQHPDGYGYVTFTIKYRGWRGSLDATMRQDHKGWGKSSLSITQAWLFPSRTLIPAPSMRHKSSLPRWARATSPTPKRRPRKRWKTGWAVTAAPLSSWVVCPRL